MKKNHRKLPEVSKDYAVFTAIKDSVQAIRNNLKTVLGSIVVIILLSIGITLLAALLIGTSVLAPSSNFGVTNFDIGPGIILSLIALIIVGALVSALVNIFLALSIDDGAKGKKTSVNDVFVRSQKMVVRVIGTEILVFCVILAPLFIIGALSLLAAVIGRGDDSNLAFALLLPLMVIGSLVWVVMALLRYILAPLVAIFEPKISIKETLTRSRQLLMNGKGQWFLVKAFGLMLLVLIVLSMFTSERNVQGLERSDNPIISLINFVVGIVFTGVLVMLYRNQKALKD